MRTLRAITDQEGTVVEVTVTVKGGHLYGMRHRRTL